MINKKNHYARRSDFCLKTGKNGPPLAPGMKQRLHSGTEGVSPSCVGGFLVSTELNT